MGFKSFTEAFNALGYALECPPGSIKNYRDEFDPIFPNPRRGWHKRPRREHCMKVLETFQHLDLASLAGLVGSLVNLPETNTDLESEEPAGDGNNQFARRLITGMAAEHYFQARYEGVPEFHGRSIENTTQLGCGYDFRLRAEPPGDFLAVEVKGLSRRVGSVSLTPKEFAVAARLRDRFFLFVVKDFSRVPFHEVFRNPVESLQCTRTERQVIQVSWLVSV